MSQNGNNRNQLPVSCCKLRNTTNFKNSSWQHTLQAGTSSDALGNGSQQGYLYFEMFAHGAPSNSFSSYCRSEPYITLVVLVYASILSIGRLRQKDSEFKASLGQIGWHSSQELQQNKELLLTDIIVLDLRCHGLKANHVLASFSPALLQARLEHPQDQDHGEILRHAALFQDSTASQVVLFYQVWLVKISPHSA